MPSWQQWWEKCERSLATSRDNLADGELSGAANRLWYAVFQGVHAVLVFQGKQPRRILNTWLHDNVPSLYIHDVYWPIRERRGGQALREARVSIAEALAWRVQADYGDHSLLDRERISQALDRIGSALQCMHEEWLSDAVQPAPR